MKQIHDRRRAATKSLDRLTTAASSGLTAFRRFWLGSVILAGAFHGALAAEPPPSFATSDAAVRALVDAVRAGDSGGIVALLGPGSETVVQSGDAIEDQHAREKFVQAFDQAHRIETSAPGKAELLLGRDSWPWPYPLVKAKAGWRFDEGEGTQEILRRRIGRNELEVIQAMMAYADAQDEYSQQDRDGDGFHEYAQKLMSSPGKHDGLYWPTKPDEPDSPLGSLFAEARAAGYSPGENDEPTPFHGYYFHVLNAQGPHARGGARDYLANGHMLGGFGLLAYPAKFGASGIMTFIVNQDGIVYQRSFGDKTEEAAKKTEIFDPDQNWKKVKVGDTKPLASATDE